MQLKTLIIVVAIALGLALIGTQVFKDQGHKPGQRVDDWTFQQVRDFEDSMGTFSSAPPTSSVKLYAGTQPMAAEANIGLSAGGAKDIGNFRANIAHNFLPLPSDITYEGLIYEYYFDTGALEACDHLFCPSYSYAVSTDPLSGQPNYYLAVGLNSGLRQSDFQRKKLNLVVVLDISGSMGSPFDTYYYDNPDGEPDPDAGKSKMQLASEAVVDLLGHLNDDDRFGVVLFNGESYLGKPLSLVGKTDIEAIRAHILALEPGGGTNMEAGYQTGTKLYKDLANVDPNAYENRIIFLTDAMPNLGNTDEDGLLALTRGNAKNGVYTTFIGIGVDFNTQLIEHITKIRGANYYSVHSAKSFKERMDEGFEFMVTPLVFNLSLSLDAQGFEIEKVYGSPEAEEATGQLMKVNTLFPSKTQDGQTKGGLVLLKLKKTGENGALTLRVDYEDRNGTPNNVESVVEFNVEGPDTYQNLGIRKGVLLARYTDFLQHWIQDERALKARGAPVDPAVNRQDGIPVAPRLELGQWERQSLPLHVMDEYKEALGVFKQYFDAELKHCNDPALDQEMEILDRLIAFEA